MEYRQLGHSGLKVSVLTMGTMTFGGKGPFAKVGDVSLGEVRRLIDIVADAGVNLIDTANIYSGGRSEELIGEAMPTRKAGMLIATKARFPMARGRTTAVRRAGISSGNARRASSGCAPTSSTSISCINGTA